LIAGCTKRISAHTDVQGGAEELLPALEQSTIDTTQGMVLPTTALPASAAPPWLNTQRPLPFVVQTGLHFCI